MWRLGLPLPIQYQIEVLEDMILKENVALQGSRVIKDKIFCPLCRALSTAMQNPKPWFIKKSKDII